MTDKQKSRPTPPRRPLGGAPLVWRWIGTGAILGFLLLSALSWLGGNTSESTGVTYSATTALGLMGLLGAFLGALVAAVVLAVVMGRRYR